MCVQVAYCIFFSKKRLVASKKSILSRLHKHCSVAAPSNENKVDFLPASPHPTSPLESTE